MLAADAGAEIAAASDAATSQGRQTGSAMSPPIVQADQSVSVDAIVFADAQVDDLETLIPGVADDTEIVLLNAGLDPLVQISAHLESRSNVNSLHFVAHGESGQIRLGGQIIDANALRENGSLVASWSKSLSANADILLYSCDTGAGSAGDEFMLCLADLTGADVAASVDKTGSSSIEHADWILEKSVGAIESAIAFDSKSRHAFQSTLAVQSLAQLSRLHQASDLVQLASDELEPDEPPTAVDETITQQPTELPIEPNQLIESAIESVVLPTALTPKAIVEPIIAPVSTADSETSFQSESAVQTEQSVTTNRNPGKKPVANAAPNDATPAPAKPASANAHSEKALPEKALPIKVARTPLQTATSSASVDSLFEKAYSSRRSFRSTNLSLHSSELSRIEPKVAETTIEVHTHDNKPVIKTALKAVKTTEVESSPAKAVEPQAREMKPTSTTSAQRVVHVASTTERLATNRISGDLKEASSSETSSHSSDTVGSDEFVVETNAASNVDQTPFRSNSSTTDTSREAATAWAQRIAQTQELAHHATSEAPIYEALREPHYAFSLTGDDLANHASQSIVAVQNSTHFAKPESGASGEELDLSENQAANKQHSTLVSSANHASTGTVATLYQTKEIGDTATDFVRLENNLESSRYFLELVVDLNNVVRQNELESRESFEGTKYFDAISRPLSLQ